MPALMLSTGPVSANPSGGIVVHGDINIGNGANGFLQINQNSQRAIINWADFSIKQGETTRFVQPGANAAVLNRVTGGDPSAIHGALRANGNVFVINPNGILVGATGTIDVHGLVLSTLDVDNGEFLAGGDMAFMGNSDSGVINMGSINAIGGDVFLLGNTVENHGTIRARDGTVGLGAGREILLAAKANPMGERVFVRAGGRGNTGVLNTGSIEGAAVELKAHGNMYALAINNKGSVRAVGAVNQGGKVFLRGIGGAASNSGSIEATAPYGANKSASVLIQAAYARVDGAIRAEGGSVRIAGTDSVSVGGTVDVSSQADVGGEVVVEGQDVNLASSAVILADGALSGGDISIGGGWQGRNAEIMNSTITTVDSGAKISANATENGNGGQVVVWSDGDTLFSGDLSATGALGGRGGVAEISGYSNLNIDNSTIELGSGGFLLLDPSNFTVTDTVRNTILPTLNGGTDVVIFTNGSDATAGNGDIIFSSNFSGVNAINGAGSLSLLAYGDLFMRRDLVNNGTGNINLVAGWDGMTPSDFMPGAAGFDQTGMPAVNMDDQIFADTSTYGNRMGSVYVGLETDKVTPVNQSTTTIGSRAGETNVAGYNLVMVGDNTVGATSGDDRTAQLGYRASDVDVSLGRDAGTGRIKVNVLNDITMTAGTKTNATNSPSATPGQYNYVQIGHGGRDATSNGYNHSGDIVLQAGLGSGVDITGNIIGTAGSNLGTFVHIGHGGHAGGSASGSFSGDITVEAGANGRVEMTAGSGRRAYAQIGHGGYDVDAGISVTDSVGYHSGNITVRAGTDVTFNGGTGQTQFVTDGYSYSMVGHGGAISSAFSDLQGHNGSITLQAGTGGVSGDVTFKAGDIDDNFAQLGHGGRSSTSAAGADGHSGTIDVDAIGDISFIAGTGQAFRGGADGRMYAQLGHGGYDAATNANVVGDPAGSGLGHHGLINVTSTLGDIVFSGGDTALGSTGEGFGRIHYAQLGHGGYSVEGDHWGSIFVEATNGAIRFTGGATEDDATDGIRNSAQLGHGGYVSRGDHGRDGDVISVIAGGDISFTGGGGTTTSGTLRSFAQLGNGGYDAENPSALTPGDLGNRGDIIVSSAGGNISFTGGPGTEGYSQLGHGGFGTSGDHSGNISVSALAGEIRFSGGNVTDTYVQLGHGGRAARGDHGLVDGDGNAIEMISVTSAGDIVFTGGLGTRAYAQLGNGGHDADAAADARGSAANIEVTSTGGNILFEGAATGTGDSAYIQLGNGGYATNGNHRGNITVNADQNVTVSAAQAGTAANAYAQLGHGGRSAVGNHSGDISVTAGNGGVSGGVLVRAGTGAADRYAQLGHGGRSAQGNHSSDIDLTSLDTIVFQGGTSTRNFVQLGHGGHEAGGTGNSGDIFAQSTAGAIEFRWGATNTSPGTDAYIQLGHGGNLAGGDHIGDITALAETNLLFRATSSTGTGSDAYVQLGHGGIDAVGDFSGDITAIANTGTAQFRAGTSTNTTTPGAGSNRYAQLGHGGTNSAGTFSGDIKLISEGAITFSNQGSVATTGGYTQLGHGGFNAASTVGHSGDITVQSRASSISFVGAPGGSTDSYAQLGHGGTTATGSHSGNIAVQSGTGITFTGGTDGIRSYAQLGHGGYGADALLGEGHSGNIGVGAGTNLLFTAGSGISQESYAQLGHGGSGADGDHEGDIVARAGNTLIFTGTLGTDAYVDDPIDPINNPQIRIENRGYAQLGHGGYSSTGNRSGDITASSQLTGDFSDIGDFDGDGFFDTISFTGGTTTTNPFSFLAGENATSDAATDAYAQLGHGGRLATGTNTGDISVDAERTIRFEAGGLGARTYAQLGHGGHDAAPVIDGMNPIGLANSGDISVQARTGAVNFIWGATNTPTSNETYVQLGHGGFISDPVVSGIDAGGHNSGDIKVLAGGNVLFRSTDDATTESNSNYAQLGHGGIRWRGNHSGDISVYAGTDGVSGTLVFNAPNLTTTAAGVAQNRYVQLGHGGFQARGDHSGDISALSYGNISFRGGRVEGGYAQLGHGGLDADDESTALGNTGDIRVASQTGNINFQYNGSGDTPGEFSYLQLGHGGFQTSGDHSGDVTVRAGGLIQFRGGTGNTAPATGHTGNYVQLGHGGFEAAGNHGGDIVVSAGSEGFFNDVFDLDMDGIFADDVEFTSNGTGTISFISGGSQADRYAQLGHGGTTARGDHSGDIVVTALGNITFTAGSGTRSYAMIGHGGHDADNPNPSYYPDNDPSNPFRGPTADERIGNTGNIRVETLDGSILFTAGNGTSSTLTPVQIGHGGTYTDGDHVGNIIVIADADGSNAGVGGDIVFRAETSGTTHSARVGHGGFEASGGHTGDIEVTAGGSITFTAGSTNNAVQIGHGGVNDHRVTRSGSSPNYVQTNNNDLYYPGTHSGSIEVNALGDITFTGGTGTASFAQIGHGGYRNAAEAGEGHTGDVSVVGGGLINFTSLTGTSGYVQIGHGGYEAFGNHGYFASSNILVDGGAGVAFTAGSGSTNYAQIGHGGVSAAFSSTLNIDPEEDAPASNTSTTTYHLNTPSVDPIGMAGDITVRAGTGATTDANAAITFTSGAGSDAYAQIGNGGRAARGDHSGDIDVSAANGITFSAFNEGAATQSATSATLNSRLQNHASGTYTMVQTGNLERGTIVITYDNPLPGFTGTIRSDEFGRLFDGATQVGTVSTGGVVTLTETVSDSGAGSANASMTFDHYNTGLRTYVQIGHGGSEADFPTGLTPGDPGNLGNISVTSENGAISFSAGSRAESYAQVGHGGYANSGDHSGNILVEALGTGGAITFGAGSRTNSYAQLGHGGSAAKGNNGLVDVDGDGMADGDITVRSAGSILFNVGNDNQTYAQLGHGGYDADAVTTPGNTSNRGNITVESNLGDIAFSAAGSSGINAYAQLGHGGYATYGDFSGDITVSALDGSVMFTGGEGNERYAQLGHGGRSAKGDHQGDLEVLGSDGITFIGGAVASVSGESNANLVDAAVAGGGATATLANTGNLDLGSVVITINDPVLPEYATLTVTAAGELLDGNGLQVGTVATDGTVTFDVAVSNAGALGLAVSYEHVNYSRGYAQLGNGGYDSDATGATVGVVGQRGNIDVNSTNGGISFAAGLGLESYAQLGNGGYGTSGDHSGNILVRSAGDVNFTGGMEIATATGILSSRNSNYAQLGHGGMSGTGSHSGTIDVRSTGGAITFQAGTSADGFVQLGHGGRSGKGDHTGDIFVDAATDITFAGSSNLRTYSQLGHGGWDADHNNGDSAKVGNSGDIFVNTRSGLVTNTGGIYFTAGTGEESYVLLGHGGHATQGVHTGNLLGSNIIDVRANGDIAFVSGDGSGFGDDGGANEGNGRRSWAQLGHGGYDSDAASTGGVDGDGHSADINVSAGGAITFTAKDLINPADPNMLGNDYRNYVQLGHGGLAANGDHSGNISVTAGNGIAFTAGGVDPAATANLSQDAYAQIGHGGYTADGYGGSNVSSKSGDISVVATGGDIVFTGSNTTEAYVQIGHGGRDVDGGTQGDISVSALDGAINFLAGTATDNYAQLGHGGRTARGDHGGDIDVMASGNIVFTGGTGGQAYAMLGHGGRDADNPNPTHYPDNDPLNPLRGPTADERIGNSGNIGVASTGGSILFTSGAATEAFVQLGHGGSVTDGDHTGNINVSAAGDIVFDASEAIGNAHYAQLGHGGYLASGGHTGDIVVSADGEIRFIAGTSTSTSSYSYVQIGHGGRNDHRLTRGGSSPNYTQTNANDRYYPGTHSGSIDVTAGNDIVFTGGEGTGAYAQVGHGGFRNAAEAGEGHNGDISVVGGGQIGFTANNGAQAYVQIGHGGYEAFGNHGYQVVRSEAGSVAATQGGTTNFTNGSLAAGSVRITVDPTGMGAGTAVFTDDGAGNLLDGGMTVVGTIDYTTGEVTFLNNVNAAGDDVEIAYLHGGSDILVDGGAGVAFAAGSGSITYAQIGHGGVSSAFSSTLNIDPEESAPATNTSTTTYHLNTPSIDPIGMSGNVSVFAGTGMILNPGASLAFDSGSGNDSYAQIGNGGRAARGDHRGEIEVSAAGDVSFDAFDGGATTQTATSGTLNSRLQNHASGTYTMAQTGNLERGTIVITYDNPLPGFTGTIRSDEFGRLFDGTTQVGTVSTGGVVTLTETVSDSGAGSANASMTFDHYNTGLRTYVQVGHGGSEADFPTGLTPGDPGNRGNISVTSENGAISFTAGSRTEAYAQVGHGGYANSGDHSGNILVEALGTDGAITFAAGSRANAYAQLGHGGSSAKGNNGLVDVDGDGMADGDITVRSTGSILFNAGTNSQTYAQLGHGGYDADALTTPGNTSNRGDILVESQLGDIAFSAAGSSGVNSFVQLGHGGYATYGDFSGDITVRALDGSIGFTGGEANDRYAQLGHGGRSGKGDHLGDIEVLGANGVVFTAGGLASVSGESNANLVDAAVAGGGATATLANTGNLDLGSVVITISDPVLPEYATLTVAATGELLDGNGMQVGTVATNGTVTFDVAVSNQSTGGIAVAYDHVNYSRGYVQLGHGGYEADPTGAVAGIPSQRGDISVASTTGNITFTAGLGDINYAQLGNGGYATSGDHSGDIVVRAAGDVNFTGGTAVDTATGSRASRANNYAQLGHGGMSAVGNHSGNITVSSGTDGDFDDVSDSTVSFAGTGNGGVNFVAGTSTDTYAQLGHGGRLARGDHGLVDMDGKALETISVTSAGDIVFTGGTGARTYAHLGHGGHDADATTDPRGSAAHIVATSTGGNILFEAAAAGSGDSAYVQLGNGGYSTSGNHTGDITVSADQNVTISAAQAGTTANAYAQLGHGGRAAIGDHSGDISVAAGTGGVTGGVLVRAGTGAADRYAQLGHGGRSAAGSHSGDIGVTSLDNIVFQGGTSTRNFVQLGHGGHEAGGNGNTGDIFAQSTAGAIEFRRSGTTTSPGTDAYIQMGHGGNLTGGDHAGDITALAETNLLFRGSSSTGTGSDAYVQMGHGGIDASGNFSGDITAVANTGTAQFRSGTSTSTTVGAGSNRYAQLGHGGTNSSGAFSGEISLISEGAITFSNQGSATTIGSYTQLGHGGFNSSSTVGHNGDLTVQSRTSSITFTGVAGGSTDSYAQLGHGGGNATGSHSGDIAVNSGTSITFTGGANGIRGYAQLGHGGHNADALAGEGHSGRIGVGAGTNLAFTAGSGTSQESYAQLGHGGFGADGNHDGDIVARSGNTLIFTGTLGTDTFVDDPIDPINNPQIRIENRGYAQLGHGGYGSTGNRSGDITASSQLTGDFSDIGDFDGDGFFDTVSFTGGTTGTNPFSFLAGDNATADAASDAFAQLGHGGRLAIGTNTGDISVDAERTIRFEAGALGARTYAQLGHGGHDAAPVVDGMNPIGLANSGNISVESRTGAVNLLWGATNTDASDSSYVQLGHGGFISDPAVSGVDAGGDNSGNISVKAGTSLLLRSTTSAVPSASNFVQIGHGGMGWIGNHSGDISAMAGTTVTATAGGGFDRYAQIGHGGTNAFGDHSGDIAVLADGNITFTGTGAAVRGYTQLGHGGHNADSLLGHSGDIGVASLGGDLVFTAAGGAQTESYTQLGHGGFDAAGAHNGNIVARAGDDITFTASGGSGGTGSFSGYAQLGHGGMKSTGSSDPAANLSGDITVSSHIEGVFNDIGNFGDLTFVDGGGANGLRFIGGQGTTGPVGADNYAQLGHGGRLNRGAHSGDIQVDSNKQILFQAGRTGSRTYVQLGHGGHDSAVLGSGPGTMGNSGSITVNAADNIDFRWAATNSSTSAETYAQLGHGGYLTDPATAGAAGGDNGGAISVTANNILFRGTTGSTSGGNYLQLGHGGMRWTGHHSGEITVDASGFEAADPTRSIAFIAGSGGVDRYAQLGHGGRLARGNHGLVDVSGAAIETIRGTGLNDIVFNGGTSSRNYAMIGNGGHDADLTSAPRGAAANIEVISSSGSVLFTGGTGDSAYAQLGNGGYATSGSHRGDVSVTADQNVVFQAAQVGGTANAYVQIGNGGRDAVGSHSGDLSVTATNGNIEFTSGAANDRYAQIGNGGRGARGNHSGDVDVNAGGNVTFASYSAGPTPSTTTNNTTLNNLLQNDAAANYTMAQTANIDRSTIVITYDNPLPGFSGIITGNATGQLFDGSTQVGTVSAGGVVNLSVTVSDSTAGPANSVITFDHINLGQRSYAQLGHGGYDADPTTALGNTGDITVTSQNGTVDFTAGSRNETFAQLGHGGSLTNGNHGGDISVQALGTSGSINFTGGTFTTTYAQLGHGGNDADGNFSGDISLGTTGDVNLSGREGTDGFAHVGHGGHNSDGTASGDISVVADGAVRLDGGSGARSYAQIGHGGQNGNGNRSGEIRIGASDLTVTGGTQAEAYALVGHGGVANGFLPTNNNYTTGTRTGSMWVDIAGTTTLADQTSIGFMGHLGTGGTTAGSGLQLLTGQLDTTTSLRGVSGMIHSMAAGGVGIGVTNGDLLVNGTGASGNSAFDIDLLATGNVLFTGAVQNAGTGDVRVAAGWDGTTGVTHDVLAPYPTFLVSAEDVVADPALYGIGGAIVNVGTGSQTRNVSVGSANGITHIVGEAVNVLGSTTTANGAAQIGFNEEIHRLLGGANAAGATGDITVHTKDGGLTLQGGSFASTSAQVGHGGQDTSASFAGDIHIDLGKGNAVADLIVRGGTGLDAYAQIGHGGRRSQGAKDGNILVNAADIDLRSGGSAYTSARIGHGGGQAGGNVVGVIDIDSDGNVTIAGGSASFAPAQIGHGGFAYVGATTASPIFLDVTGDLSLNGGSSNQSAAQVGHGGPLYNGNISGGDLTVNVGNNISVSGGIGVGSYGQIGFGGVASHGDRSGDIQVSAGNDIALGTAFGTSASYVKIGHGDDLDPALAGLGGVGNWSGDIEVGAGRNITMFNAMIGHANAVSKGTTTGGVTQIGVSRNDPTDPTGGSLIANSTSEFAGEDELRFYLPRRANNHIAAGATINGASYAGARVDPSNVQGDDEYTINIIGDQILFPNEHGNVFHTGPAPANAGGFAFYYDTIEIVAPIAILPDAIESDGPDNDDVDLGSDFLLELFTSMMPDDETSEDMQRKRKKFFRAYNPFSILYEGYDHYGPNGESTFEYQPTEELGNLLDEVPLVEVNAEETVGDVAPGA